MNLCQLTKYDDCALLMCNITDKPQVYIHESKLKCQFCHIVSHLCMTQTLTFYLLILIIDRSNYLRLAILLAHE